LKGGGSRREGHPAISLSRKGFPDGRRMEKGGGEMNFNLRKKGGAPLGRGNPECGKRENFALSESGSSVRNRESSRKSKGKETLSGEVEFSVCARRERGGSVWGGGGMHF